MWLYTKTNKTTQTLRERMAFCIEQIYGKCDCQFHDPATVLDVRPLVPLPAQMHTYSSAQPSFVGV